MGRKIALVIGNIGNSEYDDISLARLITPSEDVNDLVTLFKSPDILTFLLNRRAETTKPL